MNKLTTNGNPVPGLAALNRQCVYSNHSDWVNLSLSLSLSFCLWLAGCPGPRCRPGGCSLTAVVVVSFGCSVCWHSESDPGPFESGMIYAPWTHNESPFHSTARSLVHLPPSTT